MSDNLLLNEDGTTVGLEDGSGSVLLEDQTVTVPRVIQIRSAGRVLKPTRLTEEQTGFFIGRLIDENNDQVAKSILEAVTLHVIDRKSKEVLRRNDALDANGVTITDNDTETILDWSFDYQDTRLYDRSQQRETHLATFEFGWNSDTDGSGTDIIATTLDSTLANVTVTAHGLSLTSLANSHQIFLGATAQVGGLFIGGGYTIRSVVDANTLQIVLPCKATSTDTGGGTVTWWLNGRSNKSEVALTVERDERYCT